MLPTSARLPYHISTIRALIARGATVVLVLQKSIPSRRRVANDPEQTGMLDYLDEICDRYENLEVAVDTRKDLQIGNPDAPVPRLRRALELLRGYSSYLERYGPENFYSGRWFDTLPNACRRWTARPLARRLLARRWARRTLDRCARGLPSDPWIRSWLRKANISAVVVSPGNSRAAAEVEYLHAAHAIGVPCALAVLSWDNLTSKGLVPRIADRILAWNDFHSRALLDLHEIGAEKIAVTGSPFFDKWLDRQAEPARRDPTPSASDRQEDRYILYLGSSGNIVADEAGIIEELASMLADRSDGATRLVVRFHPTSATSPERLRGIANLSIVERELPFSAKSVSRLRQEIEGSDCVVGINTTAMIDAIILGRPCFTIRTDKCSDTHFEADHFKALTSSNVLYVAQDVAEMMAQYRRVVIDGQDRSIADRVAFVERFVRPQGLERSAGDVAADALLQLCA